MLCQRADQIFGRYGVDDRNTVGGMLMNKRSSFSADILTLPVGTFVGMNMVITLAETADQLAAVKAKAVVRMHNVIIHTAFRHSVVSEAIVCMYMYQRRDIARKSLVFGYPCGFKAFVSMDMLCHTAIDVRR